MAKADYQKLCVEFARSFQNDVAALLGVDLRLRGPDVEAIDPQKTGEETPLVSIPCTPEGADGQGFWLAVPRPDAATFAGLLLALEEAQIKERREQEPDEELRGAIGEVMKTTAAILGRTGEAVGAPAVAPGDLAITEHPSLDAGWIPKGPCRRARWTATLDPYGTATLDLLVPAATLEEWFGDEVGEISGGASAAGSNEDDGEGTTLVVVDADAEARDAIEEMEDDLGLGVWAIDPSEIVVAGFDELADARGILIDWELGAYGGLELLQALRSHPTTRRKRIALVAGHPTRRRVTLALRHGADTVLAKPYDLDEIRSRFDLGGSGAAEAATEGSAEAEPEEADAAGAEDGGEAGPAEDGDAAETSDAS